MTQESTPVNDAQPCPTKSKSRMGCAMEAVKPAKLKETVTSLWGNLSQTAANAWSSVTAHGTPHTDVIETDDHFLVMLDVPGVPSSALEVTYKGSVLLVKGERETAREAGNLRIRERSQGKFEKSIELPPSIDAGSISAELAQGVLKIKLEKTGGVSAPEVKITVQPS